MNKILIIKDELKTGGTTSSFLSLLNVLSKQTQFKVDVWVANEKNVVLPEGITKIENIALDAAFFQPRGIKKLVYYIKNGLFFLSLYNKFFCKTQKKQIKLYQQMSIARVKGQVAIDLMDYDAVITWEEFYPCYLLAEKIHTKAKIAWIHPHYENCGFSKKCDRPFFKKLDAIVAVSEAGKNSLKCCFPEMEEKFYSVENYLTVEDIRQKSREKQTEIQDDCFNIITVARLQNISKALNRAVNIAARLKNADLKFRWYFIGDGPDREEICTLIQKLNIEDNVFLLGEKSNPYKYVKNADLFVLQSYYEGKPVVVDEAMILGVPVLVTNYDSAAQQVDLRYGFIVDNNEEAIYQGIQKILKDRKLLDERKDSLKDLDVLSYQDSRYCLELLDKVVKKC